LSEHKFPIAIGIDPGMQGGIAAVDSMGCLVGVAPLPVIKDEGEFDIPAFHAWIDEVAEGRRILGAMLEQVWARPDDSKSHAMRLGFTTGVLTGALLSRPCKVETVPPITWRNAIIDIAMPKADKDATDADKLARKKMLKQSSIDFVKRKYPEVCLRKTERSRTDSDGMAEAICIALYARRFFSRGKAK